MTGFCYENNADMDALKNATFLADDNDESSAKEEIRNHFLDHSITEKEDKDSQLTVMAFQHKSLPIWGVQFHPESVSTEHGSKMMMNFQKETYHWMMNKVRKGAVIYLNKLPNVIFCREIDQFLSHH